MPTIHCAICGEERKAKNKNTKYCYPCRRLLNLKYIGRSTRKCDNCDNRYAPVERNDKVCAGCDVFKKHGPTDAPFECAVCHSNEYLPYYPGSKWCFKCAQNPDYRERLIGALQQKITLQQERNSAHGTQAD